MPLAAVLLEGEGALMRVVEVSLALNVGVVKVLVAVAVEVEVVVAVAVGEVMSVVQLERLHLRGSGL